MIVTVMGVDHELQRNDKTGDFGRLVGQLLDNDPVNLIAEEAKEDHLTIARQIAMDRSLPWLNMDATTEDKIRLGIYDELMSRRLELMIEGAMVVGVKGRYLPHADAVREELWVSRILARESGSALVVCGVLHLQHLAEKLARRGCVVSRVDVCATDWYKEQYGAVRLVEDSKGNLWYECRYRDALPLFPN